MPITEVTVLKIECDNTACPGNKLDSKDRTGWLFVSSEVYGEPGQQHVYCCADCAGADAASFAADTTPKIES